MDLNDTVTVTLTNRGAEILNNRYKVICEEYPKAGFRCDYEEGEDHSCLLWEMISKFSGSCGLGQEAVFTNLRLKV